MNTVSLQPVRRAEFNLRLAGSAVHLLARDPTIEIQLLPALRGPPGPPGPSSDGALTAARFQFGDASPAQILLLPDYATEIMLVSLEIEVPFDGAGATISLGTLTSPALLMPAAANDPASAGVYDSAPRVSLAAATPLYLSINPGAGATQGQGQLVVQVTPT